MIIRPVVTGVIRPPVRSALSKGGGVPEFITVNGVLAQLLIGQDSRPLQGGDGQYLYGRVA